MLSSSFVFEKSTLQVQSCLDIVLALGYVKKEGF